MSEKPAWLYEQSAVIPIRRQGGRLEVMLVSSSDGTHWVAPKGVIEEGMSPLQSALKEACEEAGIEGTPEPEPIGTYEYDKWGGTCHVTVFVLHVETEHATWDEDDVRQRRWLPAHQAADLVHAAGLGDLSRDLADREAGEN